MKRLFTLIAIVCLILSKVNAQCPPNGNITANGKCIFIKYTTAPSHYPDSLILSSSSVIYRFTGVTTTSPFIASYRDNSPGGGHVMLALLMLH
jgi:hypothetical protein